MNPINNHSYWDHESYRRQYGGYPPYYDDYRRERRGGYPPHQQDYNYEGRAFLPHGPWNNQGRLPQWEREQYPHYDRFHSFDQEYSSGRNNFQDRAISDNSHQIRGKIRACLNSVGRKVDVDLLPFVRNLHQYCMTPSFQHLKPQLLQVTEYVHDVLVPLKNCTPLLQQVVQTVIDCIDSYNHSSNSLTPRRSSTHSSYHGNERGRSTHSHHDQNHNDMSSRRKRSSSSTRDRSENTRSSSKRNFDQATVNATGWNQTASTSSNARGWRTSSTSDNTAIVTNAGAGNNTEEAGDKNASSTISVDGNTEENERSAREEQQEENSEVNPQPQEDSRDRTNEVAETEESSVVCIKDNVAEAGDESSVKSTESYKMWVLEKEKKEEDDDDTDDEDSTDERERIEEEQLDEEAMRAPYVHNDVVFTPGQNISPYWLKFFKERLANRMDILDMVSFQKCSFLMRNEHVFGQEFREKCAMKACDHIIYKIHKEDFEIPKSKEAKYTYYHTKRSFNFSLPTKRKDPLKKLSNIPVAQERLIFSEVMLRSFASSLANSVFIDAGIQFSIFRQLENEVSNDITTNFEEEMFRCVCPCCKRLENWRKANNLSGLFDPAPTRVPQGDKQPSLDELAKPYKLYIKGKPWRIRCDENKLMSPSELYDHCKKCTSEKYHRGVFVYNDPFHEMLGLFLEYQYAQENPRSNMFPEQDTQEAIESCIDKTFFSNKEEPKASLSTYIIGEGKFALW